MNYLENYNLNEELCEFELVIDDDYSNNYLKSCDISNYESEFVSPTELATQSLKYFLNKFPIPEGSVHTAQEINIKEKIRKNKKIKCSIELSYSKVIKNSLFLKVKSIYSDNNKIIAMFFKLEICILTVVLFRHCKHSFRAI